MRKKKRKTNCMKEFFLESYFGNLCLEENRWFIHCCSWWSLDGPKKRYNLKIKWTSWLYIFLCFVHSIERIKEKKNTHTHTMYEQWVRKFTRKMKSEGTKQHENIETSKCIFLPVNTHIYTVHTFQSIYKTNNHINKDEIIRTGCNVIRHRIEIQYRLIIFYVHEQNKQALVGMTYDRLDGRANEYGWKWESDKERKRER